MSRKTGRKAGRRSRKAIWSAEPRYQSLPGGKTISAAAVRKAAQDAAAEAEYRSRQD